MSAFAARVARLALVLWAGSLWSLALWVAPVTFHVLADRHRAGLVAAQLFRVETYLTLVIAVLVLARAGASKFRGVYLACGLLLINDWALRPVIRAAASAPLMGLGFGAWHGISGGIYVLACIAAVSVIWQNDLG